jgi:hypothetical protein
VRTLSLCWLVYSCAEGDSCVDHRDSLSILERLLREPIAPRDVGCAHCPRDTRLGHHPGRNQFDLINLSYLRPYDQPSNDCNATPRITTTTRPSATDAIFSQRKLRGRRKFRLKSQKLRDLVTDSTLPADRPTKRHKRASRCSEKKFAPVIGYAARQFDDPPVSSRRYGHFSPFAVRAHCVENFIEEARRQETVVKFVAARNLAQIVTRP